MIDLGKLSMPSIEGYLKSQNWHPSQDLLLHWGVKKEDFPKISFLIKREKKSTKYEIGMWKISYILDVLNRNGMLKEGLMGIKIDMSVPVEGYSDKKIE